MNSNVYDTDLYHTRYMIHACTHIHTHTHTHNDCSRNWVLILVGAKILWEEEGFQFGFKRGQGWAVSKALWERIPNAGSKARERNTSRTNKFLWSLHARSWRAHIQCNECFFFRNIDTTTKRNLQTETVAHFVRSVVNLARNVGKYDV